jgi:PAS domain S-box-containing protein
LSSTSQSPAPSPAWRQALEIAGLAIGYALVARLGLALHAVGGFAALVWPGSAVALAALVLRGLRLWPAVLLGAFAVNLWVGAPPLAAAGIGVGNTLEAVVGAAVLRRFGFHPALDRVRDVVALALLAAVGSTLLSAGMGVTTLYAAGKLSLSELRLAFTAWWIGDLIGDLVLAPLLLVWARERARAAPAPGGRGEAVALVVVGLLVVALVFYLGPPAPVRQPFLVFPVLVWAALRFGQRGAATAAVVLAGLAIAATLDHHGPFAGPDVHASLTSLQLFVATVALGALTLGALAVERSRTQRELGESFALLTGVVEGTSDAVFAKDRAGRYLMINEAGARALGKPRGEIIGQDDSRVFSAESARAVQEVDREVMAGGEIRQVEETVQMGGAPRTFSSTKAPLHDAAGRVIGVVGIARDITRRKQTELALEAAVSVRDEFLSIASHELRTPLAVVTLELEGLERKLRNAGLPPEAVPWHKFTRALRQCERLTRLVNSLLEVSRITTGRLQLEREPMDLAALVGEVVDRFSEQSQRAGCELRLAAPAPVIGRWDPLRLEQVITNLLSNALKFGEGKPIDVRVTGEGGVARLVVADHGIGVAAEDIERIFQRFERAVPTRNFGGLGLGLYIVRQIVDAHGGTIQVHSPAGQGTTFEVELPLTTTTEPGAAPAPPGATPATPAPPGATRAPPGATPAPPGAAAAARPRSPLPGLPGRGTG